MVGERETKVNGIYFNPNLGGLFRGLFLGGDGGGVKLPPLSKTCKSYARNFKFGT